MTEKPRPSSMFAPIDVTTHTTASTDGRQREADDVKGLLHQLVESQDRQNALMEELIEQMGAAQRQRSAELSQWKQANPKLARRCRDSAETLGKVQSAFLMAITDEIEENGEDLVDGEFVMNEFVDRFGPRLAHLNGVLQVLSQLSVNGID